MRVKLESLLSLLLLATTIAAQAPASQSAPPDFGFTYRLPEDWQVVGTKEPSPAQQQKEEQNTSSAEVKKGIACIEVPLTARHGDPPTTIVVVALPYDCYGQKMTAQDLAGFGSGAAEGLKDTFDITEPIATTYKLGSHDFWIERARATAKGKLTPSYTVEIACTLLSKAAVCWLAQAADESALKIFEQTPVKLESDGFPALVPENVFVNSR